MYQNENYWKITLTILIIFFLGLAGTSIGHIITYWRISNDWIYPEILATENAIGIISSILLTFHKSSKLRNFGILIFLATFFVELAGNVYYYYITIAPDSDRFRALTSLTRPIFDPNELTLNYDGSLRSWTAFAQGFWLPFVHVCVFAAIAILIEKKYEEDINKEEIDDNTDEGQAEEEGQLNDRDDNQQIESDDIKTDEKIVDDPDINDEISMSEDEMNNNTEISEDLDKPDDETETNENIEDIEDEGLKDYLKDENKSSSEEKKTRNTKKNVTIKKKDAFLAKTWQVKK